MIIYTRTTKETAEALGADLGMIAINQQKEPFDGKPECVIRWGNGHGLGYVPKKVINKQKAVNKAVNKLDAIKLFNQHGVRTAKFATHVPCVGRSSFHTQGQDFWLCWQPDHMITATMEGAEYFIEYIPIKQEYRVHVMDGKVSFLQRKYEKDRISSAFMGVQGFRNNWHKSIYKGEPAQEIIDTAINSVGVLGLDFGGVDILINMKDNLPYVAEVNTGPALPTPEVRKFYVDYFKEKLGL